MINDVETDSCYKNFHFIGFQFYLTMTSKMLNYIIHDSQLYQLDAMDLRYMLKNTKRNPSPKTRKEIRPPLTQIESL
jgi:hypothetical protein